MYPLSVHCWNAARSPGRPLAPIDTSLTASISLATPPLDRFLLWCDRPEVMTVPAIPRDPPGALRSVCRELDAAGDPAADANVWNEIPCHQWCSTLSRRLPPAV